MNETQPKFSFIIPCCIRVAYLGKEIDTDESTAATRPFHEEVGDSGC